MNHPNCRCQPLMWSDAYLKKNLTPKRLRCLRSIHEYGLISCSLAFGYREFWKHYCVWSLTELHDCAHLVKPLRKLGLLQREYPGSMVFVLSSSGHEVLRRLG